MDEIRTRHWERLDYLDPRRVLVELREAESRLRGLTDDPRVQTLRTNTLKAYAEWRRAALLCFGIGIAVLGGRSVYFSPREEADYDCIAFWLNDANERVFTPIQIKEVVPQWVNNAADVNLELAKLAKYTSSRDLVIGIHVNKPGRLTFSEVVVPKLALGQVWLFGSATEDQSRWFLYGDLLGKPRLYEFDYPTGRDCGGRKHPDEAVCAGGLRALEVVGKPREVL